MGFTPALLLSLVIGAPPELQQGIDQYHAKNYVESLKSLISALNSARSKRDRARTNLYMGLDQYMLGAKDDALRSFQLAISLDPRIQPPRRASSGARKLFLQAQQSAASAVPKAPPKKRKKTRRKKGARKKSSRDRTKSPEDDAELVRDLEDFAADDERGAAPEPDGAAEPPAPAAPSETGERTGGKQTLALALPGAPTVPSTAPTTEAPATDTTEMAPPIAPEPPLPALAAPKEAPTPRPELTPPPACAEIEKKDSAPVGGWLMIGLGAAATVTGVVFGALSLRSFDRADTDPENMVALRQTGIDQRTIAIIAVGAGVVGLGVGTIIVVAD